MIYNTFYSPTNTYADFVSNIESLGFVNILNPSPGYNKKADRFYLEADTRREFYIYSDMNTSANWAVNLKAHITSGGQEYDIRLDPWNTGGGQGYVMGTSTPLFGGGLTFGMRARTEFMIADYSTSTTNYGTGYNNEELDASYYPANWFAIVAPEKTGDEWIYIIFQSETTSSGVTKINYQKPTIYTHDGIIEPKRSNTTFSYNDASASFGKFYALCPYMVFENDIPIKSYNNIYENWSQQGVGNKMNKIVTANSNDYICLSSYGPFVRFR